ncbi:GTP 3',8-cyclase MoaA [Pseudoflavonifractor phocaeensis]|uniref:GTP 3',8-cyclase MoaA n=1 Tax=Pseudoflavonifractor phocaeensis TaxID=1870988 RepID=UPI00195DE1B9|nr:GTP 3',8-cyclase MoaA [Pseudoflavonifractor phocaeensis]
MTDGYGRVIDYLRISVTDRCSLRCRYCMPPDGVDWLSHGDLLTYEEILTLCSAFCVLGFRRFRLTGGEPLVRRGLSHLVAGLRALPEVSSISLTTNGVDLAPQLPSLLDAGLTAVNLSLDTLDRAQYAAITRRDLLPQALEGLHAALSTPNLTVKLNCVPMGENDDQLVPLAALAKDRPLSVRFIELMPIGLGGSLPRRTEEEVRARLEAAFGPLLSCAPPPGAGPGRYCAPAGFRGKIGFISAVSHQFCASCNRVRLTATGFLKTCLQYDTGVDLRALLRGGATQSELQAAIAGALARKPLQHHFGTAARPNDESHNMHQIGG